MKPYLIATVGVVVNYVAACLFAWAVVIAGEIALAALAGLALGAIGARAAHSFVRAA